MKQKTTFSIPEPCDQKWSEMIPNSKGRHCDTCNTTLIDFTRLNDAQIIETLKQSGPVCVRARNSQMDRPLQNYSHPHAPYQNLRAVAMGLGLLITIPTYSMDGIVENTNFNLIELLQDNGTGKPTNLKKDKMSIVVLDARSGVPLSQMKVLFLDANKRTLFQSFTNEEGTLSVSNKKLERKNARFVFVETDEYYVSQEIPLSGTETNLIIQLEPNFKGERFITIGMVEYDGLD